jgi:hypothetical protein
MYVFRTVVPMDVMPIGAAIADFAGRRAAEIRCLFVLQAAQQVDIG